jgi:hypothetical protein
MAMGVSPLQEIGDVASFTLDNVCISATLFSRTRQKLGDGTYREIGCKVSHIFLNMQIKTVLNAP